MHLLCNQSCWYKICIDMYLGGFYYYYRLLAALTVGFWLHFHTDLYYPPFMIIFQSLLIWCNLCKWRNFISPHLYNWNYCNLTLWHCVDFLCFCAYSLLPFLMFKIPLYIFYYSERIFRTFNLIAFLYYIQHRLK